MWFLLDREVVENYIQLSVLAAATPNAAKIQ
jgi:hypothetical protein